MPVRDSVPRCSRSSTLQEVETRELGSHAKSYVGTHGECFVRRNAQRQQAADHGCIDERGLRLQFPRRDELLQLPGAE